MAKKGNVQSSAQEEALFKELRSMGGRDETLIRQHAEAGLSMYGADPRYPGEFVELAPDGKYFIVQWDGNEWIREVPV